MKEKEKDKKFQLPEKRLRDEHLIDLEFKQFRPLTKRVVKTKREKKRLEEIRKNKKERITYEKRIQTTIVEKCSQPN